MVALAMHREALKHDAEIALLRDLVASHLQDALTQRSTVMGITGYHGTARCPASRRSFRTAATYDDEANLGRAAGLHEGRATERRGYCVPLFVTFLRIAGCQAYARGDIRRA